MSGHYRHTQIGWVILGVAAAVVSLGWATVPPGAPGAPMLLVAGLIVLLFGALTVEVDHGAVRLRFGVGLIRKRIPLRDVQAWREVRNPWYCGWGIRMGPGGMMWNVSGLDAVELVFADGKRFRIGTDEPAELTAAITTSKGAVSATPDLTAAPLREASAGLAWWRWLPVIAVGVILVVGLFWSQMRPPRISVTSEGLEVDTLFYGVSVDAADIVGISLEAQLPRVLRKTNGFNGAGTLRGRFRLDVLGDGRLYVEEGFAPYVLVRLREGYLVVNFREPERTRTLYDEMVRAWPDRVAAPRP